MISGYKRVVITSRLRNSKKKFPCHQCGRFYARKDTLGRHLRYECRQSPQYVCIICKKEFKQKSNYRRHAINIHGLNF